MKKTIFTLNVGAYEPEIRALTYPLMMLYARKIEANFVEITERAFPGWPIVYEKLQIFRLGQEMGNDWNIFMDADTLVHPDFFDLTAHVPPNTILHNGKDMAGHRFRYDRHFRRDGRFLGSCDWFAAAPADCIDLWRPLTDLTMEQAVANIFPVVQESVTGLIKPEHLIDDYVLSRNVSMFGLRHATLIDIAKGMGFPDGSPWLWHQYNMPSEKKLELMHKVLEEWHVQIRKPEPVIAGAVA